QDDPNRFLSHAPIHADLADETIEKFVHGPTPSTALIGGLLQSLALRRRNTRRVRRCWTDSDWPPVKSISTRCAKVTTIASWNTARCIAAMSPRAFFATKETA